MKKFLILILLCLGGASLYAQSFYVVNTQGFLYKVNVGNFTFSPQTVNTCTQAITSIAMYKNTMYYTNDARLSLSKGSMTSGGDLMNCTSLGDAPKTSSLVADANNLLYIISNNGTILNTIDPATMKLTVLGKLPYIDGGDLLFYKGDLYMASVNGIVKVNISNPALSTLVIPSNLNVFGLAAVSFNSAINKIYAMAAGNGPNTDIIEIDLDNYRLKQTVGTLPFLVFDAASDVEDGHYLPVTIDNIKASADCPYSGKGTLQVICANASNFYQYTLNNSITNNTGVFTGLNPGTYNITVTVGDEQVTAIKAITQFEIKKPEVIVEQVDPVCATPGHISFSDQTDAALYNIRYNNQLYNINYTFDNLTPGSYHFNIETVKGGCTVDTKDITLTQAPCNIGFDKVVVTEECKTPGKGNVTVLTTPGDDTYTYSLNNTTKLSGIFYDVPAGNYTLNITSKGGGTKSIPVTVPDFSLINPKLTYTKTDGLCEIRGDIKFNLSVDASQYLVQYNYILYPFDHDFSGLDAGTYHFNILKPGGCVLTQMDIPITKNACEVVTFPNTFSPNNDGVNDVFRPGQNSHPDNFKLFIYNRLGTLIFKSNNSTNGWDGQTSGKSVPTGTYYWTASYTNEVKKVVLKSGYVVLVR